MSIYKCTNCHHEWGSNNAYKVDTCDWCGSAGKIIEEKTPLEKSDIVKKRSKFLEQLKKS